MKPLLVSFIFGPLLIFMSATAASHDIDGLVKQLRAKDIKVETLAALIELDNPRLRMGYGLCKAAGEPLCSSDGSLGYGLCKVADGMLCKERGTLGYGLCTLTGSKNCRERGSVGYGLCKLAGEKNCKP